MSKLPSKPPLLEQIAQVGFALVPGLVSPTTCDELTAAITNTAGHRRGAGVYAVRNLLDVPAVADWVQSAPVRALIASVLGPDSFAVRGILFDKTPNANWSVGWHQDLAIAVRERRDVFGFRAWTRKQGVTHCQPPVEVLQSMLTLRLHLDPCGADNGPLRVLPGSHTQGRLTEESTLSLIANTTPVCAVCEAGDALLMRPLLLHSSSPALSPAHRRVVHIEFAAAPLPDGLHWHTRC